MRTAAKWIFIVCMPVLLLTASVTWAVNSPWLYQYGFEKYDVGETTGLAQAELDRAAAGLMDYFNSGDEEISLIRATTQMQDTLFEYALTCVRPGRSNFDVQFDVIRRGQEMGGRNMMVPVGSAPAAWALGATALAALLPVVWEAPGRAASEPAASVPPAVAAAGASEVRAVATIPSRAQTPRLRFNTFLSRRTATTSGTAHRAPSNNPPALLLTPWSWKTATYESPYCRTTVVAS